MVGNLGFLGGSQGKYLMLKYPDNSAGNITYTYFEDGKSKTIYVGDNLFSCFLSTCRFTGIRSIDCRGFKLY